MKFNLNWRPLVKSITRGGQNIDLQDCLCFIKERMRLLLFFLYYFIYLFSFLFLFLFLSPVALLHSDVWFTDSVPLKSVITRQDRDLCLESISHSVLVCRLNAWRAGHTFLDHSHILPALGRLYGTEVTFLEKWRKEIFVWQPFNLISFSWLYLFFSSGSIKLCSLAVHFGRSLCLLVFTQFFTWKWNSPRSLAVTVINLFVYFQLIILFITGLNRITWGGQCLRQCCGRKSLHVKRNITCLALAWLKKLDFRRFMLCFGVKMYTA